MHWSESVIPPLIMRGSGFLIFDPLPYNLITVVFCSSSPYLVKFGKEKELLTLALPAVLWFSQGAGLTGGTRQYLLQVQCTSRGRGKPGGEPERKARGVATGNCNETVRTSVSIPRLPREL